MPRIALNQHKRIKPMRFNAYVFTIEGEGKFPLPMLAIDNCLPTSNVQYVIAFAQFDGQRTVEMAAYRPEGIDFSLSENRWSEYGWRIHKDSIRQLIE